MRPGTAPGTLSVARTEPLTVFAPASIGNVSVGFDALGLALAPVDGTLLGDTVQVQPGAQDDWKLSLGGPFADRLPRDTEDNIVLQCCRLYQRVLQQRGMGISPLRLALDKRLPIGSGLGSSASSVVATLEALNRWHDHPLASRELFRLMAQVEGGVSGEIHLDNIAPCLYGGLRLCPPGGQSEYALPWPARWQVVVCWPGTELVTREARAVLPDKLLRAVAVQHGAQFAQFVYALYTGKTGLAAASLVDLIAEPYRRHLLPGFDRAREELTEAGVLAIGISGSGPTVFAVVDEPQLAETAADWLAAHYQKNASGFVHICRADLGGARSINQTTR
ncbi:MAG TPA: homoserine kinase [Xanthomonadales bacterium]|nr:homoserine kinase [Xanthomonadales bacterium]